MITIPYIIIALLILAAAPPLPYALANAIERTAQLITRALRAHADAAGEYWDALRRHYARRAS